MTQKHRKWSQGHGHGVLLYAASAGARPSVLLWVASLACILKFCPGVLGDGSKIICSSPLLNTFELTESLLQAKVVQHITKEVCILLLDLRPSRRLCDGTEEQ